VKLLRAKYGEVVQAAFERALLGTTRRSKADFVFCLRGHSKTRSGS
jgi:hypothetical protein